MVRSLTLVAILVVTALAGCATPPSGEDTAPGRIDGTLVDQFLQPYGNATVALVELDRSVQTTEKGGFSIVDVPPGQYTVQAAPPGGERTEQTVDVPKGDRAVVILQSPRDVPDPTYKAALGREGRMVAALPGQDCAQCTWTTRLAGIPDEVVLHAQWDDALGGPMVVELFDEDGSLVRTLEGTSPLWEPIDGAEFDGPHLTVRVRASQDPMPRADVTIRTALDVYYGADRESQE